MFDKIIIKKGEIENEQTRNLFKIKNNKGLQTSIELQSLVFCQRPKRQRRCHFKRLF